MIHRYENEEIRELWTPTAVYRRWWEVEVEHVRTIAGADVAEILEAAGPPTQSHVAHYEKQSGHEMIAFLTVLDQWIQDLGTDAAKARSALHYGLTSSDIQDTALALGLRRSKGIVDQLWGDLADALGSVTGKASGTLTVGRTHGQYAAVMPAAHRWEVLYSVVGRCYTRAAEAFLNAGVGKLSGPVGVLHSDAETDTLARLRLSPTTSSQLVPRDRLANWGYQMASLATACEAVATQVWLLAQQGIMEVRLSNAVGSSAMPHKRNPTVAENIRGLARMARSRAQELQVGVVQWGEHDLAHSSVERVAVPDLLHLTCSVLQRTACLVSGLSIRESDVPDDYRDTSAVLRSAQAAGMAYVDAYKAIQEGRLTTPYQPGKIADTTTIEEVH